MTVYSGKLAQKIMAIKKDLLFLQSPEFRGFQSCDIFDFHTTILNGYEYIVRGDAEQDLSYKQPIPYIAIVNIKDKTVFAYQRASKDDAVTESRLHGKWSLGNAGHIDEIDADLGDPLQEGMRRELSEELVIDGASKPNILGYINNDTVEVDKYHFGIFGVIEVENVRAHGNSIARYEMYTVEQLEGFFMDGEYDFEYWSHIIFVPLKAYLAAR